MARQTRRHTPTTNAADLHRGWLELVDTEGPFLAIPPLKRVWPNGIPDFRKTHPDRFDVLVNARKSFESAWEDLDRHPDTETTLDSYRAARDVWVETILRDVAGWSESLSWGEVPGVQAQSPNHTVTVTAQAALQGAVGIGALLHVVDPVDSLRQTPSDVWAATPVDRLEELLRKNKSEIGIVTDGRWWGLVFAREGSMAASGIVDALTWVEEPRTRDAFLTLIGRQHIIGGEPSERLPVLFEESVAAAEEITEALGGQVRSAVELLIQSFSESAADARRRGLPDPLPARTHDTYEAAVTVMMRVVFLLFAEERGLLPTGELFEQGYGISRELARLVARESEESEEALDSTSQTWHRLLSTSSALFNGASFESMRMPAYGGSLFDPVRFPFLTANNEQGTLAVTVTDRVMLHVLRSVQMAVLKAGEARQISFRDIDVEQIGYIYEGLLGYTCATVDEVYVGLLGKTGEEPEIPLSKLEDLAGANPDPKTLAAAIREWVGEDQPSSTPPSIAAIAKAIAATVDPSVISALTQAVGDDHDLRDRVRPWLGLVRLDLRKHPFVVLAGGLLVKETPSRKNAGAHYTPKSLAEEVVLHALQPLCYLPGPHQTPDESTWRLKSSDDILSLKVADIACGSGAFLVAAANYLADRVVEAWVREEPANEHRSDLYRRAIRQVVANCLYGADINDMAVEMCKLSLWLVSLDRDLPFSFVDDKVFVGNSLLGLTSLDQLRKLHIDSSRRTEIDDYEFYDVDIDGIIRKAVDLRQRLATEIDADDPAQNSAAKRRQLAQLRKVTEELRTIADGVIAAGLPLGGKPGRALDDAYENLREAVKALNLGQRDGASNDTWLSKIIEHGLTPDVRTDYERWQPLHWIIEAPDVLVERGGFDAVIGNPPFLVSKKISGAMGVPVREWIVEQVASGRRGGADLVAYFVLRAVDLLVPNGCIGLITSKAIAEGDTREVALDPIVGGGFVLTNAKSSEAWPVRGVSVRYSMLCGTLDRSASAQTVVLDGIRVGGITSQLTVRRRVSGDAERLIANTGRMQKGAFVLGAEFVLSKERAENLISLDPSTADVLTPFLSGEDVNSNPTSSPSRYVINFQDWPIERAERYPALFSIIDEHVRPLRLKDKIKSRRDIWWQFAVRAAAIHRAVDEEGAAIVVTVVSKYGLPVRVQPGAVIASTVAICPDPTFSRFAEMSSTAHNAWAWQWGSTMKSDLRYNPSDVFDTYPFAKPKNELEILGSRLDTERREAMQVRGLGLTKFYNLVNDATLSLTANPDIAAIRDLHRDVDHAVLAAHDWSDIDLEYGFHPFPAMERWTASTSARLKILDRLLEENHRRAATEAADNKSSTKSRKAKGVSEGQGTLL